MFDVVQERELEPKKHSDDLQGIVDRRTEQLYQRAHFDTLTGLPNRALLLDRLNNAITLAKRNNTNLAIMFLDLDRFKNINDSLGHNVGDKLLKAAAKLLTGVGCDNNTVAQLGGD